MPTSSESSTLVRRDYCIIEYTLQTKIEGAHHPAAEPYALLPQTPNKYYLCSLIMQ